MPRLDWGTIGAIPLVVLVFFAFFAVLEPNFLTSDNLFNLARQASYLILICMAQFIVLLTGGIDLSVGSTVSLVSVVTAIIMKYILGIDADAVGLAIIVGAAAGICTGAAVGLANGIGVAYFGVTPFVMTLGTLSMALGLALFISGGYSIAGLPTAIGDISANESFAGIPFPILYTEMVAIVLYLLLSWTRIGRYLYAIGSNIQAARLSGISTQFYLVLAYVISGTVVGIAAVLMTARTESGEASLGGPELVLRAVAGCIIGGVALTGGKGLLRNVIFGAFFITLLSNGMNLLRVNSYLQTFIMGAVLVLAIAIEKYRERFVGKRTG
ncbi:MAG: ABC transporter permease [Bauldia litoralis]